MIECVDNIQKVNSKLSPLQDAKTVLKMSSERLLKERDCLLQDTTKSFEDIISTVKKQQRIALDKINKEYEGFNRECENKIKTFDKSLSSFKIVKSINQSLKAYSEIEFIKWFTSKHNPVQKLTEISQGMDMTIPKMKLTFDKQKEFSDLKKLVFKTGEFEKTKTNAHNVHNGGGIKIGRNYKSNGKGSLNKCYSVTTLSGKGEGLNMQYSTTDRTTTQGSQMISPSKIVTNIVGENKAKVKKTSQKVIKTNGNKFKLQNNAEPKMHKEKSNILSFLRKNSKMKKSKLKCAARTKIDLKTLNSNNTAVDSNCLNDSMFSVNSPTKFERCETAVDNYITEPYQRNREEDSLINSASKSKIHSKKFPANSSSPKRIQSRAININDIKKSNQEMIRKSLQNFESSFQDILGEKIPSLQLTETSEQPLNPQNPQNPQKSQKPQNSSKGTFNSKRFSASCLDYKTRRNQKKMQKTQNVFQYRSQNTSFERVDTEVSCEKGLKEINSNERNIQINTIQGYKVKVPLKGEGFLKGATSLRKEMQSSNSFLCPHKKLNSSRKTWRK